MPTDIDAAAAVRDLTQLLDGWLACQRWYREIPALCVGISVGDETVFTGAYGLADVEHRIAAGPTTRFRIASHSKVFTATAIMQLVEQGRLRLDDRVADHLDWFRDDDPDSELAHVTIRQLLCHASGMTRDGATTHWHDDRFPDLDELISQTGSWSVTGSVEQLKYSNVAYTVAGQIIERVTGRPYVEHVTETIIEPLDLTATTPDLPDDLDDHALGYPRRLPGRDRPAYDHVRARVMNSATGFSSNVVDLLRWHQAHRFGSGELLHDRSKREMQRLQFESGETRWGLGFSLAKHAGLSFATHGGGYPGFITYSGVEQRHGIAMTVLTNAADGAASVIFDGIASLVARALDGEFDGEPPFDGTAADELAGYYETRWAVSQVARVGAKLVLAAPLAPNPSTDLAVLDHVDDWTFRYPDSAPLAAPRELVRFEHGDPPRMVPPSSPPVERADGLLDS